METLNSRVFLSFYITLWGIFGGWYFFTFLPPGAATDLNAPLKLQGPTPIFILGKLRQEPVLSSIYTAAEIVNSESRINWILYYDTTQGRISYKCEKSNLADATISCEKI